MADWKVQSEDEWERQWVEKHGREEFDRRLAIAKAKTKGYKKREWEAAVFYASQFRSIAMQLKPEQLAVAEGWDHRRWEALVNRLAGVG